MYQKYVLLFNMNYTIRKSLIEDLADIVSPKDISNQSYRYLISHQIEQLNTCWLESSEINYLNLKPIKVLDFRIIIFCSCPWTKEIGEAIDIAKKFNKKVFYDIDELLFFSKYNELLTYIKSISMAEKSNLYISYQSIEKILTLCDGAITSNEVLANELKKYVSKIYVNKIVANEEMFKLSKYSMNKNFNNKKSNKILISYFSENKVHNSDINFIIPTLKKILKYYKNVKLLFVGEIDVPKSLEEFDKQIGKIKLTNWKKIPEVFSKININIVPIDKTIINSAISEKLWLDAALVKVPTVASNYGAYSNAIIHGETGYLCNTTEDWDNILNILIYLQLE